MKILRCILIYLLLILTAAYLWEHLRPETHEWLLNALRRAVRAIDIAWALLKGLIR